MEALHWTLVGVGIALCAGVSVVALIYCYLHRQAKTANSLGKEELQEPCSTDSNTTIDQCVAANDPKDLETGANALKQQQEDYRTAVRAALTPLPRLQTVTKSRVVATPAPIIHEHAEQEPQEPRVFSLSPLHVQQSEEEATAGPSDGKTKSMCSISTTTTNRSMTPSQHPTPPSNSIWRGPTPPWTKHPNRCLEVLVAK